MDSDKKQKTDGGDGVKQQPVVDRDKVKQEREARRMKKVTAKQKVQDKSRDLPSDDKPVPVDVKPSKPEKSFAKQEKQKGRYQQQKHENASNDGCTSPVYDVTRTLHNIKITRLPKDYQLPEPVIQPEKKQLSKAERRAIQEEQRAAKAAKQTVKPAAEPSKKPESKTNKAPENRPSTSRRSPPNRIQQSQPHRVKLFNHLYTDIQSKQLKFNDDIHPAIAQLGVQYANGVVKGCNARGLAFMNAIKLVINEYETPAQKEFARSLEDIIKYYGAHLQHCRPLAISVTNAMKFIQWQIRQLPKSESDAEVCSVHRSNNFNI